MLKAANFLSTSAFSEAVVFPSAMAVLILLIKALIDESKTSLADLRPVLAAPSRYVLEYNFV